MVDFYFREHNLALFREKFFEIESDLDLFITQIQMILNTPIGDVYGESRFGNSLDRYVHEFSADANQIKSHIEDQIKNYCPLHRDIPIGIEVYFLKGEISDVAVIDIVVDSRKVLGVIVK